MLTSSYTVQTRTHASVRQAYIQFLTTREGITQVRRGIVTKRIF